MHFCVKLEQETSVKLVRLQTQRAAKYLGSLTNLAANL